MTSDAPAILNQPAPEPIIDVWSRTERKYRLRAIVLIIVDLVLFAGLCCFANWLRSGEYLAPSTPTYWQDLAKHFQFTGDQSVTLRDLLTKPINVQIVPMQIVILGLLLGAMVAIPIVVAILYRFWACLPFVAGVLFLATMPWLAITLLGSCILASVKPFRFRSRFTSALMGMLLIFIYFFGASRQSTNVIEAIGQPGDRINFIAPWVLAAVGACVTIAIVLAIAKIVDYRPGAVAPLLAVMFITPIALFETYVGRDELYYRMIESKYGPTAPQFMDQNLHRWFDRFVTARWEARGEPLPPRPGVEAVEDLRVQLAMERALVELQNETVEDCQRFLDKFPDSRYLANVLYIKARALDTRIDRFRWKDERMVHFYVDFPSPASRKTWTMLLINRKDSPLSILARYRLAQLDAREGDIEQALKYLDEIQQLAAGRIDLHAPAGPGSAEARTNPLLEPAPSESTLHYPLEATVADAAGLQNLIQQNHPDPVYREEPLKYLLSFDPADPMYRQNLAMLLDRFPLCKLSDNIKLLKARIADTPRERIELLKDITTTHPNGDAVPEALYLLGSALLEVDQMADARDIFDRLIREFPDSPWRKEADQRLRHWPAGLAGA